MRKRVAILLLGLCSVLAGLTVPLAQEVADAPEAGATITQSFRQEYRSDIFCYDIQQNYHGDIGVTELDIYAFYFNVNTQQCYAYAYHAVHAYSTSHYCWYLDDHLPYQFAHVTLVSNLWANNGGGGCNTPLPGDWQQYTSPYTDFGSNGFFTWSNSNWVYHGGGAAWHPDMEYVVRDGSNSYSPVVDWERGFRLD